MKLKKLVLFTGFAVANHDDQKCYHHDLSVVCQGQAKNRWSSKKWTSAVCGWTHRTSPLPLALYGPV